MKVCHPALLVNEHLALCSEKRKEKLVFSVWFAYLELRPQSVLDAQLLAILRQCVALQHEAGWQPVWHLDLKLINVLPLWMKSFFKGRNVSLAVADLTLPFARDYLETRGPVRLWQLLTGRENCLFKAFKGESQRSCSERLLLLHQHLPSDNLPCYIADLVLLQEYRHLAALEY